jgi:hypothetical protein
MEVMEENMKEVKVKSLKKRNQVWQLKEENQKKTAKIKELQPVGGGPPSWPTPWSATTPTYRRRSSWLRRT